MLFVLWASCGDTFITVFRLKGKSKQKDMLLLNLHKMTAVLSVSFVDTATSFSGTRLTGRAVGAEMRPGKHFNFFYACVRSRCLCLKTVCLISILTLSPSFFQQWLKRRTRVQCPCFVPQVAVSMATQEPMVCAPYATKNT